MRRGTEPVDLDLSISVEGRTRVVGAVAVTGTLVMVRILVLVISLFPFETVVASTDTRPSLPTRSRASKDSEVTLILRPLE